MKFYYAKAKLLSSNNRILTVHIVRDNCIRFYYATEQKKSTMRENESDKHSRNSNEGERSFKEEDLLQRMVKKVKRLHQGDDAQN